MPGNITHANINTGDTLTANKYNGDFINIINGMTPDGVDDYAANAAQFLSVTDPGEPGSEVLPTSLAGDVRALRFRIGEITGVPWIQTFTTRAIHPQFLFASQIGGWREGQSDTTNFWWSIPEEYSGTGTFTLAILVAAVAGTGNVRMQYSSFRHRNGSAGETVVNGTLSTSTIANANVHALLFDSGTSTWAFGDTGIFQVTRLSTDVLDTLTVDLVFLGANITFSGYAGR